MKKILPGLSDVFGLTGASSAVREKAAQEKAIRDKAPVAAEFESCTERFDRLNIVMESNESTWEPYHILLNDYRSRLITWGVDTGASSRTIDHTLRKSSRLKGHTLEILEELHASLQNILDLVETTATPMLAPPSNDDVDQNYFDMRPESILERKVQPHIEAIVDAFSRITSLTPSLRDPVPWDEYRGSAEVEGLQIEIALAERMFGKAPSALTERLGNANWKRICYLRSLQQRTQPRYSDNIMDALKSMPEEGAQLPTAIPLRPAAVGEQVKVIPPATADLSPRKHLSRRTSTTMSTISSAITGVSIFDLPAKVNSRSYSAVATSVTGTADYKNIETVLEQRYTLPSPPIVLEPEKSFLCPYCLHEVNFGSETDIQQEWTNHVFLDLEPYMCTFELCPREEKTYASKDDWFQHELNFHRMPKVYFCQACELRYNSQEMLEHHLGGKHGNGLKSEELAAIASLCVRYSQGQSKDQSCHLCGKVSESSGMLRDHLAEHLEQYALTSLKDDDEDDGPSSPQFSDSGSEKALSYAFRLGLADLQIMAVEKAGEVLSNETPQKQAGFKINPESPKPTFDKSTHKSSMASALRPSMGKRGDSYTLTSRLKTHLEATSVLSKTSSQEDSMNVAFDQASYATPTKKLIRTGLAPEVKEFEGRIEDLSRLLSALSVPGHICFLSGPGGMGKSALAAEYTYRCNAEYSYVFWVQAETPIVCASSFSQIAMKVALKEAPSNDQERLIMLSREFLEQTKERWLLVFDNVDEWLDLKKFLPSNFSESSSSILITTQKVDLVQLTKWPNTSQIDLDCLSLDESRRLLLKYTNPGIKEIELKSHPEYKLAGDVAKLAERLPLALSLIAGYILASRCSLTDFVQLWDERRRQMKRRGNIPSSLTDAALETAWNLGLMELPGDAQDLLNILAFLDPDNIQKEMIIDAHEEFILENLHSAEATSVERRVKQLKQRNLINIETRSGEEVWSIHRTLQTKILQDLNRDVQKRKRVYAQAFLLVRKRFPLPSPIQVPEPSKWAACRKYLPHVLSMRRVFTGSKLEIVPSVELAKLFSDGGISLWERGMTNEGLDLLVSAEEILDQLNCDEDLLRANIHVIISLLLQDSGLSQLAECTKRSKLALDIREEYRKRTPQEFYTKNDEILLYNARSDYGCVLLQYNKYQEAEPIFADCFEKYKTWGTPEEIPYEYAKYYHHMAFCKLYQKKFDEATELAEQGLHWVTVATGKSAAYNRWKFDLACVVLQSGDAVRAHELHQEVLISRTEQHGASAFVTLQSRYAVAVLEAASGGLQAAKASMSQILDLVAAREGSFPEAAILRTEFRLATILLQTMEDPLKGQHKANACLEKLATLCEALPLKLPEDVKSGDKQVLFDAIQPIFDGRLVERDVLVYLT